MRIVTIGTLAFFLICYSLEAQRLVIESRSGFMISTDIAFPLGKAETRKGSFVFPSLLSNFDQGYGFSIKYYKQLCPRFQAGIRYSNVVFSNWQFNHASEVFNNAEALVHSLSMNVTVRNLFHERGILNKWSFHAGLAPGVYMINVNAPELSVPSTKTVRPGLFLNGGINYAIRNNLAISISGGYQIVSVKSSIYQEAIFQWCQAGIGIIFRLERNQNYLRGAYE